MTIRILVVDDDQELLDLLERFLVSEYPEFEVECSTSAQDAIRLLEQTKFDFIVSDYHLGPGAMNGLELLEWLRDSGNRLPFVMFTGKSREEVAIRALNLGADLYLRKDEESFQSLVSELGHHIQNYVSASRTEHALAQSESRFQRLYDSSMDGILLTDLQGRVAQCNQRFAEIVGYERNDLKGADFRLLAAEEWHRVLERVGQEVQDIGRSRILEVDLVSKLGAKIPVAISSWRMDDENGDSLGAWVLVRDMSLSKMAEKVLRESEARFRSVYEDSPDGITIFDSKGVLVSANRAAVEMFGLPNMQSILGYDIFDDPDLPQNVKESLRSGKAIRFERVYDFASVAERNLYPTSRETEEVFEVIAAPFGIDEEGEVLGYTVVTRELTESRNAQLELETLRQRFRVVFENTPVGLAFLRGNVNSAGELEGLEILDANEAFTAATGLRKETRTPVSAEELYSPFEAPKEGWLSVLTRAFSTSMPSFHEVPSTEGKSWFSLTFYSPAPDLCVSVVVNITEQVRAYELLRAQKEELSDFAHHMKHDITSHLLKMEAYAEALRRDFSEADVVKMKHLIEEVKTLLNHSVELADAGLIVDEKSMVDLDAISRDAAKTALGGSATLKQDALPEVMADATKAGQIFRNIYENAVIHGGAKTVRVSMTHTSLGVVISITNDGRPIPQEDRNRVFTRGFTTRDGHPGLGLAIVRKLVQAHGWEIKLSSDNPTTFEIMIPKERIYE